MEGFENIVKRELLLEGERDAGVILSYPVESLHPFRSRQRFTINEEEQTDYRVRKVLRNLFTGI